MGRELFVNDFLNLMLLHSLTIGTDKVAHRAIKRIGVDSGADDMMLRVAAYDVDLRTAKWVIYHLQMLFAIGDEESQVHIVSKASDRVIFTIAHLNRLKRDAALKSSSVAQTAMAAYRLISTPQPMHLTFAYTVEVDADVVAHIIGRRILEVRQLDIIYLTFGLQYAEDKGKDWFFDHDFIYSIF